MPEYRVSWVIDVVTDNHDQAAEAARAAQIRAGTVATMFTVAERLPGQRYGPPVEVDLEPGDIDKLTALMDNLTRAATARCDHASALRPVNLCRDCGAILAEGVELELTTVGTPDPTPKHVDEHCLVDCHPGGECTREAEHKGQHVAGDREIVIGVTDAAGPW